MKNRLLRLFRSLSPLAFQKPIGPEGIKKLGHRHYVGGMWNEIGKLQFEFLVSRGLQRHHYLLDIACGSLRLGVKVIPYLDPGHYLGIEKEQALVSIGLEQEVGPALKKSRNPRFVISSTFEFDKFSQTVDFAIAQSLFTHLPPRDIGLCFSNLRSCLAGEGVFYATYFESQSFGSNPKNAHDHACFFYTKDEMREFGEANGFETSYIGDWNHPRNQVMVEYRRRNS